MLNWFRKRTPAQTTWSANVVLTAERIVKHSSSRTYNNRGWYLQPVFGRSIGSDTNEIGSRLPAALEASVWDFRTDDSQLKPHPILVEAGFKSWNALERNSRLVAVSTDRRSIWMIPHRATKRGEGQGLIAMDKKIEVPWASSDTEIGKALISAFDHAIGKSVE